MTIHPENPLLFDFIVDRGQDKIQNDQLKGESEKLIKYFLASMTIPDKDAWVNLSPYEKDRIIPDALGRTEMGRVMLEQDYVLKQLAASLTNPDTELGSKYWKEVERRTTNDERKASNASRSTFDVPRSTFSKVWIIPDGAIVVEKDGFAYITESKLKVMLDEDYEALQRSAESRAESRDLAWNVERGTSNEETLDVGRQTLEKTTTSVQRQASNVSTEVSREMILPKLIEEVNTGKNFAATRQVYQSVILASWYKRALKDSLLGRIYADKSKIVGIESDVQDIKQKVYEQYLETFKKGVYNVIKEENGADGEMIPRKYFSGGTIYDLGEGLRIVEGTPATISRTVLPLLSKSGSAGSSALVRWAGIENDKGAQALAAAALTAAALLGTPTAEGAKPAAKPAVSQPAPVIQNVEILPYLDVAPTLEKYLFSISSQPGQTARFLRTLKPVEWDGAAKILAQRTAEGKAETVYQIAAIIKSLKGRQIPEEQQFADDILKEAKNTFDVLGKEPEYSPNALGMAAIVWIHRFNGITLDLPKEAAKPVEDILKRLNGEINRDRFKFDNNRLKRGAVEGAETQSAASAVLTTSEGKSMGDLIRAWGPVSKHFDGRGSWLMEPDDVKGGQDWESGFARAWEMKYHEMNNKELGQQIGAFIGERKPLYMFVKDKVWLEENGLRGFLDKVMYSGFSQSSFEAFAGDFIGNGLMPPRRPIFAGALSKLQIEEYIRAKAWVREVFMRSGVSVALVERYVREGPRSPAASAVEIRYENLAPAAQSLLRQHFKPVAGPGSTLTKAQRAVRQAGLTRELVQGRSPEEILDLVIWGPSIISPYGKVPTSYQLLRSQIRHLDRFRIFLDGSKDNVLRIYNVARADLWRNFRTYVERNAQGEFIVDIDKMKQILEATLDEQEHYFVTEIMESAITKTGLIVKTRGSKQYWQRIADRRAASAVEGDVIVDGRRYAAVLEVNEEREIVLRFDKDNSFINEQHLWKVLREGLRQYPQAARAEGEFEGQSFEVNDPEELPYAITKRLGSAPSGAPGASPAASAGQEIFGIGISMGGTKIGAALINNSGKIVERREILWRDRFGDQATSSDILSALQEILRDFSSQAADPARIKNINIGFAGPLDESSGRVGVPFKAPNLPFENFDLVQGVKDAFTAMTGQDVFVVIKNDAHAAALGEIERNGWIFILGTGANGAIVLEGNIYTDDNALLELGHNIVLRKQDDGSLMWTFTGREMHGDKPVKLPGESSIEDLFSGSGLARSFVAEPGARAIVEAVIRLPAEIPSVDRLFEMITLPEGLSTDEQKSRALGVLALLQAITLAVKNNDNRAIDFVKTQGRNLGLALASLAQIYRDEAWVANLVLVSGVSENFARVGGKEGEDDIFLSAIREGMREGLGKAGVPDARAQVIARGVRRSNMNWEREVLWAKPASSSLTPSQDAILKEELSLPSASSAVKADAASSGLELIPIMQLVDNLKWAGVHFIWGLYRAERTQLRQAHDEIYKIRSEDRGWLFNHEDLDHQMGRVIAEIALANPDDEFKGEKATYKAQDLVSFKDRKAGEWFILRTEDREEGYQTFPIASIDKMADVIVARLKTGEPPSDQELWRLADQKVYNGRFKDSLDPQIATAQDVHAARNNGFWVAVNQLVYPGRHNAGMAIRDDYLNRVLQLARVTKKDVLRWTQGDKQLLTRVIAAIQTETLMRRTNMDAIIEDMNAAETWYREAIKQITGPVTDERMNRILHHGGVRNYELQNPGIYTMEVLEKVKRGVQVEKVLDPGFARGQVEGSRLSRGVAKSGGASSSVGGIDFDPSKLNLQIKRDGRGVPLPLPQQDLQNIDIKGLYPVIINILPINAQTLPILGQMDTAPDAVLSRN